MNEIKIIDRKLLTDLAKEVGLNASHLEALGESRHWEIVIDGDMLEGWLRFNIGSSGWPQWVTMSIGVSISRYHDLRRKSGAMQRN